MIACAKESRDTALLLYTVAGNVYCNVTKVCRIAAWNWRKVKKVNSRRRMEVEDVPAAIAICCQATRWRRNQTQQRAIELLPTLYLRTRALTDFLLSTEPEVSSFSLALLSVMTTM